MKKGVPEPYVSYLVGHKMHIFLCGNHYVMLIVQMKFNYTPQAFNSESIKTPIYWIMSSRNSHLASELKACSTAFSSAIYRLQG